MKIIILFLTLNLFSMSLLQANDDFSSGSDNGHEETLDGRELATERDFQEFSPQDILPGRISRAFFTNSIENREPTRVLNRIESSREAVYFFSELVDFTDQIVTHRWLFNDTIEAEVTFEINGPRWRFWSLKTIPVTQRGLWQVDVIDQQGMIVESYPIMAH